MPALGADMDAGILLEWKVAPGDTVKRGDIVAVVETSKADIEVEVFEDGVVERLLVDEGLKVPVGTPLAVIAPAGAAAAVTNGQPEAPPVPVPHDHHQRVSPVARRVAAELGVDVAGVTGTGPGGAVTKHDVEAAAGKPAPPPPAAPEPPAPRPSRTDRRDALQAQLGVLMERSKHEIPHYYLSCDIDMGTAVGWIDAVNAERPVADRLVPSALLLTAAARAAREHPRMNGFWRDGAFSASDSVHLGVAISLRGGGIVAPAIHDADQKTPDEVMAGLRDLVRRAREGTLRGSEMSDPTLTVTNLGDQGVSAVFGVIYPPQVALIGFGKVLERPWARDGMLGARPVVTATLSADHRVSDGHAGARFLATIDRLLQRPEDL